MNFKSTESSTVESRCQVAYFPDITIPRRDLNRVVRLGQDRHPDAPYKYGPIIARRTLVLILIKPAKLKLDDHYQMLPQIRQSDVSKGGAHDD